VGTIRIKVVQTGFGARTVNSELSAWIRNMTENNPEMLIGVGSVELKASEEAWVVSDTCVNVGDMV